MSEIGNDVPRSSLFASILWRIRKDRNKKSFANIDVTIPFSHKAITAYSWEIVEASFISESVTKLQPSLIHWNLPCTGEVKVSTGSCWYDFNGKEAGFGGLFKDCSGAWILGYYTGN